MRILFDENIPEGLDPLFPGHDCNHVIRIGWAGVKNGALLSRAESSGFQVLLTFDQGIPSEQKLERRSISVIVLKPDGQGIQAVRRLVDQIQVLLSNLGPGEVHVISNRPKR